MLLYEYAVAPHNTLFILPIGTPGGMPSVVTLDDRVSAAMKL